MTKVYLAIGHGLRPNGTMDPGATAPGGIYEHDQAITVTHFAELALIRSGVKNLTVEHAPDVDYVGSTRLINEGHYDFGLEVHFDTAVGGVGGFGIYSNPTSRAKIAADSIRNRWGQAGLPQKNNYADVRGLLLLQGTHCPCLIWECDRIGPHDVPTLTKMGEAIAAGMCDYLGVPFVAIGGVPPVNPKPATPAIPIQMVDAISAAACGSPGEGAYVLAQDGGVFCMHGNAPMYGSFPGLPPGDKLGNHVFNRIRARANGLKGYILIDTDDHSYEFGPGLNGEPG